MFARRSRVSVEMAAPLCTRLGRVWSLGCLCGLIAAASLSNGRAADGSTAAAPDSDSGVPWKASISIWFFSGRADLDATEGPKIAALAARARADPGLEFGIHQPQPDRVPDPLPGSVPDQYLDQLGPQRLAVIRDAMVAAGIPADRIHVGAFGGRIFDVDRRTVIFVRSPPSAADAALPRQDDDVSTE